jgi:hypothetical protein
VFCVVLFFIKMAASPFVIRAASYEFDIFFVGSPVQTMPALVRCLAQDTNAACARQARHLASLDFDVLGGSQLKAGSRQPNFQTAVIQILWFGARRPA